MAGEYPGVPKSPFFSSFFLLSSFAFWRILIGFCLVKPCFFVSFVFSFVIFFFVSFCCLFIFVCLNFFYIYVLLQALLRFGVVIRKSMYIDGFFFYLLSTDRVVLFLLFSSSVFGNAILNDMTGFSLTETFRRLHVCSSKT
jgi:hypothetical protein